MNLIIDIGNTLVKYAIFSDNKLVDVFIVYLDEFLEDEVIESLAKSLAAQLATDQVTVNCVAPGYTQKDGSGHSALSSKSWEAAAKKTPMGRIGVPEDTAGLVAFLLSEEAQFITGQIIHVDGGLTIA